MVKQVSLEEEYSKPTGITREDISELRTWLKTQPHMPSDHITDLDLILTYYCCDRSAQVTKQLLDTHFTLKTLFTGFFKDRRVDEKVGLVFKYFGMSLLPSLTKEGYCAFYTSFLHKDPTDFVLVDVFRVGLMVVDLYQYESGTWPGAVILYDLKNMTLGHLARLDIQSVQQYICYLQDAILVKLKGLHFLNAPPFIDRLLLLIKPFMNKSLLEILYVHQAGASTVDQFYPSQDLPADAGGKGRSAQELTDEVYAKMLSSEEFFAEENKKRVEESKRPGRPKTMSDIFGGVVGSFKKLDID